MEMATSTVEHIFDFHFDAGENLFISLIFGYKNIMFLIGLQVTLLYSTKVR